MGRLARLGVSELFALQGRDGAVIALPEKDSEVRTGDTIARVRVRGKEWAVSTPIGGKVLAVNTLLEKEPERLGQDSYDTGWLAILRPADNAASELMTAQEYRGYLTRAK